MISTESLTDVTTCVSWGGCAPANTCIHCDDWTIQQYSLKGTYCDHVVQLKQNSVVWSELIYIYIYIFIFGSGKESQQFTKCLHILGMSASLLKVSKVVFFSNSKFERVIQRPVPGSAP